MTRQGPVRYSSLVVLAGCFRLIPHTHEGSTSAFIPLGLFDPLKETQKGRDGGGRSSLSDSTHSPGVVFPLTELTVLIMCHEYN